MKKHKAETFFALLTCLVSVGLVVNLVCQNQADRHRDQAADCQNEIIENMAVLNSQQTAMYSLMTMTELRQFIKVGVLLQPNVLTNEQMRTMVNHAFETVPKNELATQKSEQGKQTTQIIRDIRSRKAETERTSRRWALVAHIALYLALVLNVISLAPLWCLWRKGDGW